MAADASQLFPPQYEEAEEAKTAILLIIRRDPQLFGYSCSRWKLSMIRDICSWLRVETMGGLSQLLKQLGISYKRGREYVHSPDPSYDEKLSLIELMRLRAYYAPESYVFLYLDELTYYRQPTIYRAYEVVGKMQPLAYRSHNMNTRFRVLGALNALTGQLNFKQGSRTTTAFLSKFWYDLRSDYPDAETIYVVVDNWPVHFHPDVLAPLQAQNFPFPQTLPANWQAEPSSRARVDDLPIQLLCLPTYASWLNPIEKLWRWLKQDILHMHRNSDDWPALKERVDHWLTNFSEGSPELLRYVGLLPI
jgi:hypothetical protein